MVNEIFKILPLRTDFFEMDLNFSSIVTNVNIKEGSSNSLQK